MGQHRVFRVADEGLDLQVLLDEAEEDLDLPAFFLSVGDGLGRQLEMVGEKDAAPAGKTWSLSPWLAASSPITAPLPLLYPR